MTEDDGAPSRILVVGSPGAGKTTVATRLAEVTGLPLHHLDDAFWGPGWTRPDHGEWTRYQRTLVADDRWIIDGNHLSTLGVRIPRADVVVVVHAPAPRCAVRAMRRAIRIRRGWYDGLPARVRPGAGHTGKVQSTNNFLSLLTMIMLFRFRSWPPMLACLRANGGARLVIAVNGRGHSRRLRARLRRAGVPGTVVPARRIPEYLSGADPRR